LRQSKQPPLAADAADDPALSTAEAAAYLGGMHTKTLNKLARTRKIEFIQLAPKGPLKFRRSALNEFLNRHSRRSRATLD